MIIWKRENLNREHTILCLVANLPCIPRLQNILDVVFSGILDQRVIATLYLQTLQAASGTCLEPILRYTNKPFPLYRSVISKNFLLIFLKRKYTKTN